MGLPEELRGLLAGALVPAQGLLPRERLPGLHLVLMGEATGDAGQNVHALHVVTLPPWPTTHHA